MLLKKTGELMMAVHGRFTFGSLAFRSLPLESITHVAILSLKHVQEL